jgi:hypothetical protein
MTQKIADFVSVPAGSEIERPLGENEYLVPVAYDMPRDKEVLESEFGSASELFYGNYEWQLHSSCAEIDQTPGNRVMLLKRFSHDTMSEAHIAEMDVLGYRPATHLELYAFAKVNPPKQGHVCVWITALGSFTMYRDPLRYEDELVCADERGSCYKRRYETEPHPRVASACSCKEVLCVVRFDSKSSSNERFLFVRK